MFFDPAQRNQFAASLPDVLKRPFVTISNRIYYARTAHAMLVGPVNRVRARTIIELHAQTARNGFTSLVELPAAEVHLMRGRQHRPFRWLGQAYPCALRAANDFADRVGWAIEEAMHPNCIDLTSDTREEDSVDHWHAQLIAMARRYGVLDEAGSPGPEWDAFRARYLAAMQGREWTQGAASELWAEMMSEAGAAADILHAAESTSAAVAKRKEPKVRSSTRNDARDRWIYDQCCKGIAYRKIVGELGRIPARKKWDIIETVQGIRRAAIAYADAHGRPHPPRRQDL